MTDIQWESHETTAKKLLDDATSGNKKHAYLKQNMIDLARLGIIPNCDAEKMGIILTILERQQEKKRILKKWEEQKKKVKYVRTNSTKRD